MFGAQMLNYYFTGDPQKAFLLWVLIILLPAINNRLLARVSPVIAVVSLDPAPIKKEIKIKPVCLKYPINLVCVKI